MRSHRISGRCVFNLPRPRLWPISPKTLRGAGNPMALLFVAFACLSIGSATAEPLDTWRWRNPLPQGHSVHDITFGNGLFVAVGEFGTVLTSTDGATWAIQNSGTREELRGVGFGNGIFVAVGGGAASPVILTSRDARQWTRHQTPSGARGLYDVAYGNGRFVIVGEGARSLLSSSDGVTWTSANSAGYTFTDTFEAAAFGQGMFVVAGSGGAVLTSPDGRVWNRQVVDAGVRFLGLAESDRTFVAVGTLGAIFFSADGFNWSGGTSGTDRDLLAITYANNSFVAVGSSGVILTSSDGATWTARTSGTGADLSAIAYGNGRFAAGGLFGAILTSPNLVNWTSHDSGSRAHLNSLCYGNGVYVAVGASGAILTSTNASNWQIQKSGTANNLYGVTVGKNFVFDNLFVAVGANGTILVSPDGANWLGASSSTILDLWDVEYGGGLFVAVGSQGLVTSPDGVQWTRRAVGEYKLLGIGYGNGRFVAVGEPLFVRIGAVVGNSPILTSPDGITWTDRDSGTRDVLFDVAYGNGTFLAVGRSILASSDGANWSSKESALAMLRDVTFADGSFVAVGDAGAILSSSDGNNWRNRNSATGRTLHAVGFYNGTFMTAGDFGTILQSDARATVVPPSIVSSPQSQAVTAGTNVTLSVIATGSPPLNYQWRLNGVALPGATNSTLSLANVQDKDAGAYTVVVSNSAGSVASAAAQLTVHAGSQPAPSFVIEPNAITNDYTGKVIFTISGLSPGQTVAVDTYLDENANAQIDAGELFVHSISLTDGRLPWVAGVRNLNVPGDEDATVNGVIRAELNFDRRTEIDAISGFYLFKVSASAPGFTPAVKPFTIVQKTLPQGITGKITGADGRTPLAGALAVLVDIDSGAEKVAGSAFTDASGGFTLLTEPGAYLLLASKPGFLFAIDSASVLGDPGRSPSLLVDVAPNQFFQRHLSMTAGGQTITGALSDRVSGQGIPGAELFALGLTTITTATATNSVGYLMFGNTDTQGKFSLSVTSGSWSITGLPRALGRLGYLLPSSGSLPGVEVKAVDVVLPELRLPRFTSLIYGSVKGPDGTPIRGAEISASGPDYQTAAITDSNGNYALGVLEGEWTLAVEATQHDEQTATVQIRNDQSVSRNFVLVPKDRTKLPEIHRFTPESGPVGTTVTIFGANLTAASEVLFGFREATFQVVSNTEISAKVPPDAVTARIRVTTPAGTAVSPTVFTLSAQPPPQAPAITGFLPDTGPPGTRVTISGTRFDEATEVKFGGVSAGFIVISSTTIGTSVPFGATSGVITVQTAGGAATSGNRFTVTASANQPPSVRITEPADGQSLPLSGDVFVAAIASDLGGAIKRVVFYADGASIYDLDTAAFATVNASFRWKPAAAGKRTLVAMAVDDQDAASFSKAITVMVGAGELLPALSITRSAGNLVLTWPINAVGFQLEATSRLSAPAAWTPVLAKPSVAGDQFLLLEPVGAGSRFYRLRRAP